jgi:hypothetical protein
MSHPQLIRVERYSEGFAVEVAGKNALLKKNELLQFSRFAKQVEIQTTIVPDHGQYVAAMRQLRGKTQ